MRKQTHLSWDCFVFQGEVISGRWRQLHVPEISPATQMSPNSSSSNPRIVAFNSETLKSLRSGSTGAHLFHAGFMVAVKRVRRLRDRFGLRYGHPIKTIVESIGIWI